MLCQSSSQLIDHLVDMFFFHNKRRYETEHIAVCLDHEKPFLYGAAVHLCHRFCQNNALHQPFSFPLCHTADFLHKLIQAFWQIRRHFITCSMISSFSKISITFFTAVHAWGLPP